MAIVQENPDWNDASAAFTATPCVHSCFPAPCASIEHLFSAMTLRRHTPMGTGSTPWSIPRPDSVRSANQARVPVCVHKYDRDNGLM